MRPTWQHSWDRRPPAAPLSVASSPTRASAKSNSFRGHAIGPFSPGYKSSTRVLFQVVGHTFLRTLAEDVARVLCSNLTGMRSWHLTNTPDASPTFEEVAA